MDQSDVGNVGIFSQWTNQTYEMWEYSHNGPIRRRKGIGRRVGGLFSTARHGAYSDYNTLTLLYCTVLQYTYSIILYSTLTLHNITSFYGSSCANNGKGALNTTDTLILLIIRV
eukprot:1172106-Pyramimonas_sp.AAC.1